MPADVNCTVAPLSPAVPVTPDLRKRPSQSGPTDQYELAEVNLVKRMKFGGRQKSTPNRVQQARNLRAKNIKRAALVPIADANNRNFMRMAGEAADEECDRRSVRLNAIRMFFALMLIVGMTVTTACQMAANAFDVSVRTIYSWRLAFEANGGSLHNDEWGKHSKTASAVDHEDFASDVRMYIKENGIRKGEKNVFELTSHINDVLLPRHFPIPLAEDGSPGRGNQLFVIG